MKQNTLVALAAILQGDPLRTESDRAELLRVLGLDTADGAAPGDRLLSIAEAARRLNRTPRALHLLAKRGILRKAKLPGAQRFTAVRESDLQKLLEAC